MKLMVNGDRIQQLRTQCAWTQEQLAEKAGLSVRTVQRLERGENASLESIQVLATLFDVDTGDLLAKQNRTHFSAPWSRKLQITTAAFLIVIIAVTVSLGPNTSWIGLGVLILAAFLSVRGYSVVEGKVLVHRLGWSTRLNLSQLRQIEANPGVMMGSARLMGVGGLFASLGTFRNELLGVYRAYATDGKNAVVLDLNGSMVVVTPDSPTEFVKAVLAQSQISA
jgi:transcriptional regulator with XRE-family HTH domain